MRAAAGNCGGVCARARSTQGSSPGFGSFQFAVDQSLVGDREALSTGDIGTQAAKSLSDLPGRRSGEQSGNHRVERGAAHAFHPFDRLQPFGHSSQRRGSRRACLRRDGTSPTAARGCAWAHPRKQGRTRKQRPAPPPPTRQPPTLPRHASRPQPPQLPAGCCRSRIPPRSEHSRQDLSEFRTFPILGNQEGRHPSPWYLEYHMSCVKLDA